MFMDKEKTRLIKFLTASSILCVFIIWLLFGIIDWAFAY